MLREVHGFTDAELAELARSSVLASRASDHTKRRLLAGIADWLATPDPAAP
jgi:adenosine deaminase